MDQDLSPDHYQFTQTNIADFIKRSCSLRSRYLLLWIYLGCSTLLLLSEIFVGASFLLNKSWIQHLVQSNQFPSSSSSTDSPSSPSSSNIPTNNIILKIAGAAGWIVLGSVGLSICAVLWDWMSARSIVESNSIPKAFLNITAFRLWSIKSYAHFCLLSRIEWGHNMRQRMAMAVYFGIQGFTLVLAALPRLFVYGIVIYNIKSVPDFGISQSGFQWLHLKNTSDFNSALLLPSLVIIGFASVVHTFHLVKVIAAGIVCCCTVCYLGRIKRTIDRELKCRISRHVLSTLHSSRYQHESNNTNKTAAAAAAASPKSLYELNLTKRTDQYESYHNSEKVGIAPQNNLNTVPDINSIQDDFHDIELNSEPIKVLSAPPETDPYYPVTTSTVNNAFHENFPFNSFAAPFTHIPQDYTSNNNIDNNSSSTIPFPLLLPLQPSPPPSISAHSETNINMSIPQQSQISAASSSTLFQHSNSVSPSVALPSNTLPGSRLASLSFYDDLLKSISSERMMYASSLSHPLPTDHQYPIDEEDHSKQALSNISEISLPPIRPTYSGNSSYNSGAVSGDIPIHPFDTVPTNNSSTLQLPEISNNLPSMSQPSVSRNTSDFTNSFYFSNLSRSQSANSQETIENWRVRVVPSSPPLDYDTPKSLIGICSKGTPDTEGNYGYDYDFDGDEIQDSYDDSVSRRGTIPIILSSHLLEATSDYQANQDSYFSATELHIPRPSYAYGQTRTQRQGSINSSIGGGNNYSAASSPSLADSLSNPMYHQQSQGVLSAFNNTRGPSLRKFSLPSQSPFRDESMSRPYYPQHPHPQASSPQYLGSSTGLPIRTRKRSPSHLSNMINHSEIGSSLDFPANNDTNQPTVLEKEMSLSVQNKTHFRSRSIEVKPVTRRSINSLEQPGYFLGAQIGYTSIVGLPPSSMSHIYQIKENNQIFDYRSNGNINQRLSYRDSLATGTPIQGYPSPIGGGSEFTPSQYYAGGNGSSSYPQDMSPFLQLQIEDKSKPQEQSYQSSLMGDRPNYYAQQNNISGDRTEKYVGLGLTLSSDCYFQQGQYRAILASSEVRAEQHPIQNPKLVKYLLEKTDCHNNEIAETTFYPGNEASHMGNNHHTEMIETYVATNSDIKTSTSADSYQVMIAGSRNDYESDMINYHKQQLNMLVVNQRLSQQSQLRYSKVQRQPSQRNKKNLVVNIV